jgi:predicted DNA-binding transcriptional regulator YafY
MADTAARMLALLGLLQARSDWSGAELAHRLRVTDRTVRNDIDRLRGLGYPVDAVRGPGGRYRLGVGTKLPPLLLEEDEAVAVAVGLRAGTGITGIEETSARALAKLEHVLPHRLQRRVNALRDAVSAGPENTGSNVDDPIVDPSLLSEVAGAVRDHVELRFDYRAPHGASRLQLEPYRLVSWQRRWFVVARDARTDTWAPYRLDWMHLRTPGGRRFTPQPLPGEDYTSFVLREVAFSGWLIHTRIEVDAPAEAVLARINPTVGVVESVDADHCVLVTGGDSVEIIAVYIGMLGLDFHVTEPPALVEAVARVGDRYRRAVTAPSGTPAPDPRPGSR